MKIFVAYGYNERDKWIPEMVFPLIRAFGDEPVAGDEMPGEVISAGVIERIKRSDALIAFATRRVREEGVDDQGGVAGDRQRILYEEAKRDKCIVEIVKALGNWRQGGMVKLQLLPTDFVKEILPILYSEELKCSYCLYMDNDVSEDFPTRIIPISNGLFVRLVGIPNNALIQVKVRYRKKSWNSVFESTDSLGINMFQSGDD
jgi:hypothetical protein